MERVLQNPTLIAEEITRRHDQVDMRREEITHERQLIDKSLSQCDRDLNKWEQAYLGDAISLLDFKEKRAEIALRRESLQVELEDRERS